MLISSALRAVGNLLRPSLWRSAPPCPSRRQAVSLCYSSSQPQTLQDPTKGGADVSMECQSSTDDGVVGVDVMAESFGKEYATRSEEEGFGVVYGREVTIKRGGSVEDDDGQPSDFEKVRTREDTKATDDKGQHKKSA